jgi:hypothetical protein
MLSRIELRKLSICRDLIAGDTTEKEIAKKYNVNERTVRTALAWGRNRGLFIADNKEKIERNICDLQKILSTLERQYKIVDRAARKRSKKDKFGLQSILIGLSKNILLYKTRIMELEGLYHKVVEHRGEIQHTLNEPLRQMMLQITSYNGN